MAASDIALPLLGLVAGVLVGSYLATMAIRWPAGRSAAFGRSACDGCGAGLGPRELIPLLSWAVQRGRCRRCGARIDPLHPAIEAGAAAIGAAALASGPTLAAGAAGAVFGWALLLLAALDWRALWLADRVVLPLAIVGLAASVFAAPALPDRLLGAAAGFLTLELVRRFYRRARGREGLGGGDPKLLGAIGAWVGWATLPGVLLGASLLGLAGAAIAHLAGHRIGRATRVPFGAVLAPAGFTAWLVVAARQAGG